MREPVVLDAGKVGIRQGLHDPRGARSLQICYPSTMFELEEFLRDFERVRERTRRVAACIPEEHVEWTYKPGAFTLGDLVRHIAVT